MDLPFSCLNRRERRSLYARMNRKRFNMEAVFSDETEMFVKPYDPLPGDRVTIRLRTARNDADKAALRVLEAGAKTETRIPLVKKDHDILFDYYEGSLTVGDTPLHYYFSIEKENRLYFYNKRGLYDTLSPAYHFRLIPGFRTPDWAKGALMYQIFVDRFYNGDPSNDVVNREYIYLGKAAQPLEWEQEVPAEDIAKFYGGDLQGIIHKLAYLKSLGVEVLYLNPVFVSPSNHKYDIQDYDYVDPHFGVLVHDDGEALSFERFHNRFADKYKARTTDKVNLEASNALLARLIALAHEQGMKVILDGVFNHCGSFNKWMDKGGFYAGSEYPPGAYREKDSPYHDYFLWYDQDWPNNDCYDGWWGNENHPKLNYEASPVLYEYIMSVAKKWVSPPYNADGWRLDVAADLGRSPGFNHQFWQDFRRAVKSANPQALIVAEHYGDVSPWLSGGEWDTVMNYDAFMEPVSWFFTGVNKHSEESQPQLRCDAMAFENAMRFHMAKFSVHSLQTAMNELSNHDHSRFLTRTNWTTGRLHTHGAQSAGQGIHKSVMMEAVVFQMTWPGAPTIYYGDEAGLVGWTDPDNRRPYPWGKEDEALLTLHRALAKLRQEHPVLKKGSLKFLRGGQGVISYGRWDTSDALVVALNNNSEPVAIDLPVWKIGLLDETLAVLLKTCGDSLCAEQTVYPVQNGCAPVVLPAYSSLVLGLSS